MNHNHPIRRIATTLAGLAVGPLAWATGAPSALAMPAPSSVTPAARHHPLGWHTHPPMPAHSHTLAVAGLPGWQVTIVVTLAILLAAAAVAYRLQAARRRVSAG